MDYPTTEELFDVPMGVISGDRATIAGFNSIERQERGARIYIIERHAREVSLWYNALTVLRDGMIYGTWEYTGGAEPATGDHLAWSTKTDLCGAAAHAAKGIIDLVLAAQYNLAYAGIRHMAETVMQINFLTLIPEEAGRWHGAPGPDDKIRIARKQKVREPFEPPRMGEMMRRLPEISAQGEKRYKIAYKPIFGVWKEMCKGAHPSHEGVSHAANDDGTHSFGPKYDDNRVEVAFEYGLIAIDNVVLTLQQCAVHDPTWHTQAHQVVDAIRAWHDELRSPPVPQMNGNGQGNYSPNVVNCLPSESTTIRSPGNHPGQVVARPPAPVAAVNRWLVLLTRTSVPLPPVKSSRGRASHSRQFIRRRPVRPGGERQEVSVA